MHADPTFTARVRDAVAAIDAPVAPVQSILLRASEPETVRQRGLTPLAKFAMAAAAAVAFVALTLPITAPGLAQTIEAKIVALLGWTPPPAPPHSVSDAMKPRAVTLDEARTLVHFDLVAPSGLPSDVVASKIYVAPTGVYDNATHAWHVGEVTLSFVYRRTGGRYFTIEVARFDPRTGPPTKYVYNGDETGANGLPKRYERFAWRNGDQLTSIVGGQLDEPHIAQIRAAMNGTPLQLPLNRADLRSDKIVKMKLASPDVP